MKIFPVGARIWVDPLEPIDDITARAAASGLHVVIHDENVPRPTTGRVIALGNDPLVQEMVQIGDIAFFSRFDGKEVQVEGRKYLSLELREIISLARPDPPTSEECPAVSPPALSSPKSHEP